MMCKNLLVLLVAILVSSVAYSQEILNIELPDEATASLVLNKQTENNNLYYYLPVNFRTAVKDSIPQFSLMYYTDENKEEAILHVMLTWGLSEEEQMSTENILTALNEKPAIITGAISLINNENDFTISQNTQLGKLLNRSIGATSQAPLLPGSKMALSFKINSEDTKLLKTLLKDKQELEETYFTFCYNVVSTKVSLNKLTFNIPFIKFYN